MNVLGMEMPDLPEGSTALECVVLVKFIDEDGDLCYATRASEGMGLIERIGMLRCASVVADRDAVECFRPSE